MKNNETELLKKIENLNNYSENSSYKSIANFILQNKKTLKEFSIFSVAKKTNTSASTVTRFCKRIGLTGYKSLSSLLEIEINFKDNQIKYTTNENNKDVFIDKAKEVIVSSISNTLNNDENKIITGKKMIEDTNIIFIFCKGALNQLLRIFQNWLIRMKYNVIFSDDIDQQLAYSNNVSVNDLVFVVSYSLSSSFFQKVFANLKEGTKKIIITKNLFSKYIDENTLTYELGGNESLVDNTCAAEVSTFLILKLIYYSLLDIKKINYIKRSEI